MMKIGIGILAVAFLAIALVFWHDRTREVSVQPKFAQVIERPNLVVADRPEDSTAPPPTLKLSPPTKTYTSNGPLVVTYEELKKAADMGDRKASCRLGAELVRCKWHSGWITTLKKQVEELSTLGKDDPKYAQSSKRVEGLEKLIAKDKEACAGFPSQAPTDGWRYVFSAANAGDSYSAIRFAQGTSLLSPTEISPLANAEGWVLYKQNAFPMLEQALENGYPQAAILLSRFYRGPYLGAQFVPEDIVKSVALLMAVRTVANAEYKDELTVEIEDHLQYNKVSAEDRLKAEAIANQIALKFKSPPKDGLDLRNGLFEKNDGSECK